MGLDGREGRMSVQTISQILRCLTLGRYTAHAEDGELKIRGPQPLAGPLPASIKARRGEIVDFLLHRCGGVWPAAEGSELYSMREQRKKRRRRLPWLAA